MKIKPLPVLSRPPLIGLYLIVLSIILHYTFPIKKIIIYPYNLLGISGIIIGFWIALWGGNVFKEEGAPIIPGSKPEVTVESGPFKFSRNPMYLGLLVILIGIAVLFGSLIVFISPIGFFLIMNFWLIPFEEKLMIKVLGKKYLDYKERVRRWL